VPLVWVVYPRTKTVVVYRPGHPQTSFGPGDVITGEDILPGFEVQVDDLFDLPA
jgi:Uma2 family endonuclease